MPPVDRRELLKVGEQELHLRRRVLDSGAELDELLGIRWAGR